MLTPELEATLNLALDYANRRRHEFATLEHLLLALLDDPDAAAALRGCNADLSHLRNNLIDYLNTRLRHIVSADRASQAKPTAGFQRALQRAAIHIQTAHRDRVNGLNLLIALFSERESHATYFLSEEGVTRASLLGLPPDPREAD